MQQNPLSREESPHSEKIIPCIHSSGPLFTDKGCSLFQVLWHIMHEVYCELILRRSHAVARIRIQHTFCVFVVAKADILRKRVLNPANYNRFYQFMGTNCNTRSIGVTERLIFFRAAKTPPFSAWIVLLLTAIQQMTLPKYP